MLSTASRSIFFILIISLVLALSAQVAVADNPTVTRMLAEIPNASDEQQVEIYLDVADYYFNRDLNKASEYIALARTGAETAQYEKGIGRTLLSEGLVLQYQFELLEAKAKFQEALVVFDKINHLFFKAKTLNNIGNNLLIGGQYIESIDYYEKARFLYEQVGNKRDASDCVGNIGLAHEYLGNFASALDYYLQGLELAEASDYKEGIGYSYDCIGNIHGKLNNLDKSIEYQRKAVAIFEGLDDEASAAPSYVNIGINYKKREQYDSALFFFDKAEDVFRKVGNFRGIAVTLQNIGSTHRLVGDQEKALSYFRRSNDVCLAHGLNGILPSNYRYATEIFLDNAQLDSAQWYGHQGLELAEASRAKEVISEFHLLLSSIYEQWRRYDKALDHHRLHLAYQDTLFNETKSRQLQELNIQYETQKKEQQIALQESMLNNKNLVQKFLIVIVLLLIAASAAIYLIHKRRQAVKRKLLEEQIKYEKREKERVKELEQLKSHFYANIAHEFRTPLTLILGPAQNIQDQPDNTMAVVKNTNVIKKAAQNLLNLINQLLDLSKLEDQKVSLNLVKADFIPFVRGLVMSFESLAIDKGIQLELHNDIDSMTAYVDHDRTDKIFYNLLSNAFKFTERGGKVTVNVTYEAACNEHPAYVKVTVRDSGIGIPEDQLPMIFDRFHQIKHSDDRYVEGTGIGLSLAKELVELHQGTITVDSQYRQGTTFVVRLPAAPEATASEEQLIPLVTDLVAEQEFHDEIVPVLHENIVLLIEDNHDVRAFIKDCLVGEYQVLEAKNGREGVAMAASHIPDLIISDVMMPEMDGHEVCKTLKDDSLTSHIPIVMLTAKAGLDSRLEGLEMGADDYLEKPFNRKELLARVKNLIHSRKLLQEKYASENKASNQPEIVLPPKENQFIKKVREIIDEHLDDSDFGVEDLCKEAGVSRTQLHRKIKALTDLSTTRFVRMHKLQKALVLLQDRQYNISEVSYMTGFSSPSYFTQCFSEEFGHAPSEVV